MCAIPTGNETLEKITATQAAFAKLRETIDAEENVWASQKGVGFDPFSFYYSPKLFVKLK